MKLSYALLLLGGLTSLDGCRRLSDPLPAPPTLSLVGRYQVFTLSESPYVDVDNSINELILFDGTRQNCAAQPATLQLAKTGLLTTSVAADCRGVLGWLDAIGLPTASHWMLEGSTLRVTPKQGLAKTYSVEQSSNQLSLSWEGPDSSFVGLAGDLVTYSLVLKRL